MKIFSLKKKKVLITGGNSGIGKEICQGFKKAGAEIGVFDKDYRNISEHKEIYLLDLADLNEVKMQFNNFIRDFKKIDILVNCAGMTITAQENKSYPLKNWHETMDVNLTSIFFLCQLAGQNMIKNKTRGSIINVTSIGASRGFPNNPAYCASKGGLKQLTKAFAHDWGKYNIRVNNLVPGYTKTKINQTSWKDKKARVLRAKNSMIRRWADPKEFIGPAIFLASEASSYITGSDLNVDGGWLSKGI